MSSTTLSARRPSRADENRDRALRAVREEEPEMARMSVLLPKSLLRDIKMLAIQNDQTVSEIVREFLVAYKRKHSRE